MTSSGRSADPRPGVGPTTERAPGSSALSSFILSVSGRRVGGNLETAQRWSPYCCGRRLRPGLIVAPARGVAATTPCFKAGTPQVSASTRTVASLRHGGSLRKRLVAGSIRPANAPQVDERPPTGSRPIQLVVHSGARSQWRRGEHPQEVAHLCALTIAQGYGPFTRGGVPGRVGRGLRSALPAVRSRDRDYPVLELIHQGGWREPMSRSARGSARFGLRAG